MFRLNRNESPPPFSQKQGGKETYKEMYKKRARACQHPCVFRKAFQARREPHRQYHAVVTVLGYVSTAETQAALFTTFGSNCEACCGGLHGKSPSSLPLGLLGAPPRKGWNTCVVTSGTNDLQSAWLPARRRGTVARELQPLLSFDTQLQTSNLKLREWRVDD